MDCLNADAVLFLAVVHCLSVRGLIPPHCAIVKMSGWRTNPEHTVPVVASKKLVIRVTPAGLW